jgi:uncharacterized protein
MERPTLCAEAEDQAPNGVAKVTHGAAIGRVDQRQLETLMARGLSPKEAVDVIVRGILS